MNGIAELATIVAMETAVLRLVAMEPAVMQAKNVAATSAVTPIAVIREHVVKGRSVVVILTAPIAKFV